MCRKSPGNAKFNSPFRAIPVIIFLRGLVMIRTICVFALFCALAAAQTITGTITGTVMDPSGAVVPNVKVTATNAATNLVYNTQSSQAGVYNLLFLPIGDYT